ncbi:hypothetical protein GCM10009738_82930 [Kitasatospora viridis]
MPPTPEANIAAPTSGSPAPAASAADGRPNASTPKVPASSSRRGCQRTISSPPATSPAPIAALASPHGRGPPSRRSATSGPSTDSAAIRQAFTTPYCTTTTHSQRRERNSCQPSRSSASIPGPGSRGAGAAARRKIRSPPAAASPVASSASTQPGPTAATSAPPSAAPTICEELSAVRNSAKAREACRCSTESITMPSEAGAKNASPIPLATESSTTSQSRACPVSTSTASRAWESALPRLAATITRCRGSRSASAPPISRKSTVAASRAPVARPIPVAPPPMRSTAKAVAMGAPALPRPLTTVAAVWIRYPRPAHSWWGARRWISFGIRPTMTLAWTVVHAVDRDEQLLTG